MVKRYDNFFFESHMTTSKGTLQIELQSVVILNKRTRRLDPEMLNYCW